MRRSIRKELSIDPGTDLIVAVRLSLRFAGLVVDCGVLNPIVLWKRSQRSTRPSQGRKSILISEIEMFQAAPSVAVEVQHPALNVAVPSRSLNDMSLRR